MDPREETLRKKAEKSPQKPGPLLELAEHLLAAGNRQTEAAELLNQAEDLARRNHAKTGSRQDRKKLLSVLKRRVALFPGDPGPAVRLARLYHESGDPRAACEAYENLIALFPDDLEVKRGAFEALATLKPKDIALRIAAAENMEALGRPVEASSRLVALIKDIKGSQEHRMLSLDLCRKAVKLDPESVQARSLLHELVDPNECLDEAVENLHRLGLLYQSKDQSDSAKRMWHEAMDLQPSYKPVIESLKSLTKGRSDAIPREGGEQVDATEQDRTVQESLERKAHTSYSDLPGGQVIVCHEDPRLCSDLVDRLSDDGHTVLVMHEAARIEAVEDWNAVGAIILGKEAPAPGIVPDDVPIIQILESGGAAEHSSATEHIDREATGTELPGLVRRCMYRRRASIGPTTPKGYDTGIQKPGKIASMDAPEGITAARSPASTAARDRLARIREELKAGYEERSGLEGALEPADAGLKVLELTRRCSELAERNRILSELNEELEQARKETERRALASLRQSETQAREYNSLQQRFETLDAGRRRMEAAGAEAFSMARASFTRRAALQGRLKEVEAELEGTSSEKKGLEQELQLAMDECRLLKEQCKVLTQELEGLQASHKDMRLQRDRFADEAAARAVQVSKLVESRVDARQEPKSEDPWKPGSLPMKLFWLLMIVLAVTVVCFAMIHYLVQWTGGPVTALPAAQPPALLLSWKTGYPFFSRGG